MNIVLWKTKSERYSYRSLLLTNCSWWLCAPMNIKFNKYGGGYFGFEFLPVGFNKYNQGWSLRILHMKLVYTG